MKRKLDVLVLSDIHLGTYGCHAEELVKYLRSVKPEILILNGDIIDGWYFSKRYFPKSHMAVIKEITKMLSKNTTVYYITGNHDEMLRRFSGLTFGDFHLLDKMVLEFDNKSAWIFHGDVFDSSIHCAKWLAYLGGHGYNMIIWINRLINKLMQMLGRPKMSFSKKIKDSVKRAVKYISDFETTAAELAIRKKYDYVICGHIHQPQMREIHTPNGSVMYLNSGDWMENLTSLEYYDGTWHIFQYQDQAFPEKINFSEDGKVSFDEIFHRLVNAPDQVTVSPVAL